MQNNTTTNPRAFVAKQQHAASPSTPQPTRLSPRHRRRGTALLLVVGLLALVSVLAVVYAAVGRSDTRITESLVRQGSQRDVSQAFANYLAGVIADDALSTVAAAGNRDWSTRETWDYPSTHPQTNSLEENPLNSAYFRPTGSRLGVDPWLADDHPSWLGNPDVLLNATPQDIAALRVAYSNISVFSPDGRFVNLWNLRNYGWDVGNLANTNTNFNRSIYGRPVVLRTSAAGIPGAIAPVLITGGQPTPARLASTNRLGGNLEGVFARPIADLENQPNNPLYLPYSFADATGDGYVDSRWIELVDSRVFGSGRAAPIIDSRDGLRWFVAVRAVDLASKANVNTATDRYAVASATLPLGMSPADVDLRRLLIGEDIFITHDNDVYSRLARPQGVFAAAADFGAGYNPVQAYAAGTRGYLGLMYAISAGTTPPFDTPYFANLNFTPFPTVEDRLYWSLLQRGAGVFNNNQGVSLSGFTLHDERELRAFGILNNPATLSPLEQAIDGRFGPTDRRGPTLSQRTSEIERLSPERSLLPGHVTSDEALARRAVDIRSRLTTASASRPLSALRPIPNSRIDPTTGLASAITTEDLPLRLDELLNLPDFSIPNNFTIGPRAQAPATASFLRAPTAGPNAYRLAPALDAGNATEPGRANQLFHNIVRALMPALHDADPAAQPADGWRPQRRTEVYGYHPEFAWRAAGHIVANLAAMVAGPSGENRFAAVPFTQTLVDRAQDRTQINGELDPTRFPAFNEAFELNPPRSLQATQPRPNDGDTNNALVGNNISATTNAISTSGQNPRTQNVYGVRPYPVMVGVAFYSFHVDAPTSMGGDDEVVNAFAPSSVPSDFDPTDNMFPENPIPITIDPKVTSANSDFLMEVVAFQLHNPFPVPIRLSGPDDFDFYIEFGGHYFPLAAANDNGTLSTEAITLSPDETRTFFATSPFVPDHVNQRWIRLRTAAAALGYDTSAFMGDDFITQWASARLATTGTGSLPPVHIVPYPEMFETFERAGIFSADVNYADPLQYSPGDNDSTIDLLSNPAQNLDYNTSDRSRVAMLWRVVRSEANPLVAGNRLATDQTQIIQSDITLTANRGGNHRWNDELVDRLQDNPTSAPAIRRLLDSEDTYSFILNSGGNQIGAGIENDIITSRRGSNTARVVATYAAMWRRAGPGMTDPGVIQPFMLEGKLADEWVGHNLATPRPWFNNARIYQNGQPADRWIESDMNTYDNPGVAFTAQLTSGGAIDVPELRAPPSSPSRGTSFFQTNHLAGLRYSDVAFSIPMLLRDEDRNVSLFRRPADVLLALAVGPSYDPGAAGDLSGTETRITQLQKQWTTFGEAAAMAMGYQWHNDPNHPYHLAGAGLGGNTYGDRLDRGRLRLDGFVPFIASTAPTNFSVTSVPEFNQNNDLPIGLGIPAALGILDGLRTHTPFGLQTPVAGQVSINTASVDLLRTLPLMSFTFDPNRPTAERDLLDDRDAAAAVFAYREKSAEINRSPNASFNNGLIAYLDLNPANPIGRRIGTGIRGIREDRGFRSPAELLAVTLDPSNTSPGFLQGRREFAFTGFADDGEALSNTAFSPIPALQQRLQRSTDDYSESLAAYNAVANTVTARSDVFAVWFLMHGYAESDVQGLGPNDPLVPSVARRFLMIVDRSNVTAPGDAPRVLMFQELPL